MMNVMQDSRDQLALRQRRDRVPIERTLRLTAVTRNLVVQGSRKYTQHGYPSKASGRGEVRGGKGQLYDQGSPYVQMCGVYSSLAGCGEDDLVSIAREVKKYHCGLGVRQRSKSATAYTLKQKMLNFGSADNEIGRKTFASKCTRQTNKGAFGAVSQSNGSPLAI